MSERKLSPSHQEPLSVLLMSKFSNFNKISEEGRHCIFKATDKGSRIKHDVHCIDFDNSKASKKNENSNIASTLFLQEALFHCTTTKKPQSVEIRDLRIWKKKIMFSRRECFSVQEDNPPPISELEKMVSDLMRDIYFLTRRMRIPELSFTADNIYCTHNPRVYFFNCWQGLLGKKTSKSNTNNGIAAISKGQRIYQTRSKKTTYEPPSSKETYNLGLITLEMIGFEREEGKALVDTNDRNEYKRKLEEILRKADKRKVPKGLRQLLSIMLQKDPASRNPLQEIIKSKAESSESTRVKKCKLYIYSLIENLCICPHQISNSRKLSIALDSMVQLGIKSSWAIQSAKE